MTTTQATEYVRAPFTTISGEKRTLSDFAGKTILTVNTASECGLTPQYKGLEELYQKYRDKGFVIIGFPANNFGEQEPGTNEQIKTFCEKNYSVSFPMMAKVSVKGGDMHPLFAYLTEKSPFPGEISWNFNKFLLDKHGVVIGRFAPKIEPLAPEVASAIEAAL